MIQISGWEDNLSDKTRTTQLNIKVRIREKMLRLYHRLQMRQRINKDRHQLAPKAKKLICRILGLQLQVEPLRRQPIRSTLMGQLQQLISNLVLVKRRIQLQNNCQVLIQRLT